MSISPSTSHYELKLSDSASRHSPRDDESVASLFSPESHLPDLVDHQHTITMRDSPTQRANPMSLSTLCSPPAHSSLPPHVAKGCLSNEARLTHSPSSSNLSSPPYVPPSPVIAVLDSPAPAIVMHEDFMAKGAPVAANADAESSNPASVSTSRKRHREDSERPQTPVLPPDDFDERTKTWRHATGFRRHLSAGRLTQPDAPTRKKRPNAPLSRRTATPTTIAAARNVLANPTPSTASQNSGSGDSANEEEEDELHADIAASGRLSGAWNPHDEGSTKAHVSDMDPEEAARLEKKRRQNTQAARRSRIRKAEEVQKLQSRVTELEAEVIAGQQRLTDAKRDAVRLDALHRNEVEYSGILKNSILNLVGDQKGSEAIGQATQRWRAITSPVSPSASAGMTHLHEEPLPPDIP